MTGITGYGGYIPVFRLSRDLMAKAWGRSSIGGERSIANNDEDSATMAVEAVFDCLNGRDRSGIGGLFFASTTAPYREKEISSLIAATADLPAEILTADFANGLRSGVAALRAGLDAVGNGSAKSVVVAASDSRMGYPQSESEQAFGDGAAAVSVGSEGVIATVEGHYALSNEMMDVWRNADDTFVRSWESRWVLGEGYSEIMGRAISGLLKKKGVDAKGITLAAFPGPDLRTHRRLAQVLGFDPKTQVTDPLLGQVGDCGAAHPLMLLASALEAAKPGDTILLGAYGNGAEAFLFKATGEIGNHKPRRGMKDWLPSKLPLATYEKYLSYRGVLETQPGDPFRLLPSATAYWRDVSSILRFRGSRCKACGTLAFPIQRVCYTCRAKDSFEEVRLSDHKGKVFTFSLDNLAGRSDDPVVVQTVVESEVDQARIYCLMTDFQAKDVQVGMPVEFSFRRIYEGAGFQNYFWKCRPVR